MLTKFDEMTCHQDVLTFDQPATSDRAWTEKIWCHVHDRTGRLSVVAGLGVYPNRNVMDGYGCACVGQERQVNLRLSRELRPRIDETAVGPLRYEVVEPFRRIHVTLGENDQDLTFDLELLLDREPAEEDPQFGRSRGKVFVNTCRYAQSGRARGRVTALGETFDLDEATTLSHRDHSWGIRMGVGAPEAGVQEPDIASFLGMMINWSTFRFDGFGLTCYLIEKADGTVTRLTGHKVYPAGDGRPSVPIVGVEHDFRYHPGSARMASGEMTLALADGSRLELSMKELTTMYLRGGGYLGVDGFFHGLWMGPSWSTGEVWQVGDPKVANEAHGLDDTVCEVRCGDAVGYGIMENLVLPPFPRYGF